MKKSRLAAMTGPFLRYTYGGLAPVIAMKHLSLLSLPLLIAAFAVPAQGAAPQ